MQIRTDSPKPWQKGICSTSMSLPALLGVACALVLAVWPSLAYAVPTVEDKESARNLFRLADEKYQAGDYEGALASFTAADAIMRLPTTGLEVGRTLAKLNKLIEAREKLRTVATLEPEDNEVQAQADAREEARALFKDLEDQIPSLQVRLQVPGGGEVEKVSVLIDGEALRVEAALLPRRVNPGTHVVVVRAPGYETEERKVTVRVAQAFVLEVDLVEAKHVEPEPRNTKGPEPTPQPDGDGADAATTLAVVMFAVGGASLIVGGVTGALTLVEANELEDVCPDKRCTADNERQLDKTVTLSHVSTATLVGGGVFAAVGLIAILLADGDESATARPLVGPGYVGVGGTF